jgi:hypothetical protein
MTPVDFETLTPEHANELWDRLKDGCIDDFSRNQPALVAERLTSPNTVCFEGVGWMAMVSSILPRLGAEIHFITWGDISETQAIREARGVIAYVFETYKLERLSATPPKFNKKAARIAMRMGFRFEGCIRHAFLYHNKYFDVDVYGLLRSEWEQGRH